MCLPSSQLVQDLVTSIHGRYPSLSLLGLGLSVSCGDHGARVAIFPIHIPISSHIFPYLSKHLVAMCPHLPIWLDPRFFIGKTHELFDWAVLTSKLSVITIFLYFLYTFPYIPTYFDRCPSISGWWFQPL